RLLCPSLFISLFPSTATSPPYFYSLSLHDALPIFTKLLRRTAHDPRTDAQKVFIWTLLAITGATFIFSVLYTDYSAALSYFVTRSEEHTSELQSRFDLVCRLLLEKKYLSYIDLQYH